MIEKAAHYQGIMSGAFLPQAVLTRGAAIAQAYTIAKRFSRRPKAERIQLEAEYE